MDVRNEIPNILLTRPAKLSNDELFSSQVAKSQVGKGEEDKSLWKTDGFGKLWMVGDEFAKITI